MRKAQPVEAEIHGFVERVFSLVKTGEPIRLQFGFAMSPHPGFINIDISPWLPETDTRFADCDMFFFPFADIAWPIPDNCVDYVFHEDFIEHIGQKQQVCFLAETLRVLKPGCWHRVNTPCLNASMRRHSHFGAGAKGVYTGEWDRWNHISLFTRNSLEEMARLVGYREVVFNLKNQSVSCHRPPYEVRPLEDRDVLFGNIYADLLK